MSANQQTWQVPLETLVPQADGSCWYALHTRARHEKAVAERLHGQGVTTFLPLVSEVHRWSDRRKEVELPLFSCYVFARLNPHSPEDRWRIYRANGVFAVVSMRGQWTPIPNQQIEAVRKLITQRLPWSEHPFLKVGQRVRVRGGALDGVEGVLLSRNGDRALIISVDAVQRSLAVSIQGYDVEPL